MFTSERRDGLRSQLLSLAERDPRIAGAAVTGSAANGREDQWSDIDLCFGVAEDVALDAADALVRTLTLKELRRALQVAATRLISEFYATDPGQAQRLERPIRELADLPEVQPQDSPLRRQTRP